MSDNNFNDDEFFNKIENNFSLLKLLKGKKYVVLFVAILIEITVMILNSGRRCDQPSTYNNSIITIYSSYVDIYI